MGTVFPNVELFLWKEPRLSIPRPNGDLMVKGTVDNVNTDRSFAVLSINTKAIMTCLKNLHIKKNKVAI
jgi:hypothetical protein